MYLVFRASGYPAQAALWQLRSSNRLRLYDLSDSEADRMAELMETYRDRPMDLADASLVAAYENLGRIRLFTLDNDFRIYRLADGSALELAP
jgi:uncharacterized protein